MQYAAYPPLEGDYLTSALYDRFEPGWRAHVENPIKITPEISRAVMENLQPVIDAVERHKATPEVVPPNITNDDVFTFIVDRLPDPGNKL